MTVTTTKTKFGWSQRNNPTPKKINDLYDAISGLLGVMAGFFSAAAFISHSTSDIVVFVINMLLIPACPFVKRLHGVHIETKYIPSGDVSVVDNDVEKDK